MTATLPLIWVLIAIVVGFAGWWLLDGSGWGLLGELVISLVAAVASGLLLHRCACDAGADLAPSLVVVGLLTASVAVLASVVSGGPGRHRPPRRGSGSH